MPIEPARAPRPKLPRTALRLRARGGRSRCSMALQELPHDCLCHVLYCAGATLLRSSIPLVCRAMRMGCWEDAPWHKLCDERFGQGVASSVSAAGRLRRWRCIYGALERWDSRIGCWQLLDAYPFGMLINFRWSCAGGVVADVIDKSVRERGSLAVNRAQMIEVTFVEDDTVESGEGICNSADVFSLRLHGVVTPGSTGAAVAEARMRLSADRAKFAAPKPVQMRFVGERHVPAGLFGPQSTQHVIKLATEVMVVEWSCTEQVLPEGADEQSALQGGWRRHVSVPTVDVGHDEGNGHIGWSISLASAANGPAVVTNAHREIMDARGLPEGSTWMPPLGRYDQMPEASPGHDLRVAWLLRGIEDRGPAQAIPSLARRIGTFTMSLLEALSSTGTDDSPNPAATAEVLSMTLGRLPALQPQPHAAARTMMPQPGLYCGDYGPFYAPFNVEIIQVHYEELDETESDVTTAGWLYGTKVTGDVHVCMGMRTFRVQIQAGDTRDVEQQPQADRPPVWADAAAAMRDIDMAAGADDVLRCWPGYGTLAQMGGRAAHEEPGNLVLWASGQLAFCWDRGQSPVLLHSLVL
eukprot:COSAG02_NODE_1999_length_10148_cov_15.105483_3_plen_582_part_00